MKLLIHNTESEDWILAVRAANKFVKRSRGPHHNLLVDYAYDKRTKCGSFSSIVFSVKKTVAGNVSVRREVG